MSTIASIMVRIGADIKGLQTQMEKASKSVESAGRKMNDIGQSMSWGVSLPLIGVGAAAMKASTDFNSGMANIQTLIPGNIKRVQQLKKNIQDMALTTGKDTTDLANGMYQIISAFGDSADSAKDLKINAKAAAAGLASTTDAINLTSAVTKGYGDTSAKAVQHVSDLAFETVKLGQTTFPELAASMGQAVPLAKQLGVHMETLFGAEATLTGVTGDTSEVTTGLRAAMQALMAPTSQMQAALKGIGYNSGKAAIHALGFKGTLDKLVHSTHGNTAQLSKMFGQVEGLTQVLALTGSQSDNFTKKLAAMQHVTGATNQAFKDQTQGINKAGYSMAQFKEKLQITAEKLGDAMAPALMAVMKDLQPMIDGIQRAVNWFSNLNPHMQSAIVIFAAIVAAVGPLLTMFGAMAMGIGALGSAFSFLAGPIGIIIAAIAALVFIGFELYKHWGGIAEQFKLLWSSLANWAAGIFNGLIGFFKKWGVDLLAIFFPIIGIPLEIHKHWNQITKIASDIWNPVKSFFKKWGVDLLAIFVPVVGIPLEIHKHWSQIVGIASNIWGHVKSFLGGIFKSINNDFHAFLEGYFNGFYQMRTHAETAAAWIGNAIYRVQHVVRSVFTWIVDFGKKTFRTLAYEITHPLSALKSDASKILQGFESVFRHIHIPLPHPSFSIGHHRMLGMNVPYPEMKLNWYKSGGIFSSPSVIGVGEAGTEVVTPVDKLTQMIRDAIGVTNDGGEGGHTELVLQVGEKELARLILPHVIRGLGSGRVRKLRAVGKGANA